MAADAGARRYGLSLAPRGTMFVSRTIVDTEGARWLVYELRPMAESPTLEPLRARHERRRRWLAFESEDGALRELVPVPDEWPRCDDVTLVTWLAEAREVSHARQRRRSDPSFESPPEAQDR